MKASRFGTVARATPLALLCLAGCGEVLDPAGPVGHQEKLILLDSLAIMLCIIVPVIAMTLGFAWWYRAGNSKARYLPDFTYSGRIEALVWAIPVMTILFLGGIAWIGSHDLDPPKPIAGKAAPVEIQVVSLDWKWLFIYPAQGIATVNQVVIPAGTPIRFRITSASVMNAFFIPRLGSMIYAMNGMETKLNLMADRPDRFMGLSSHYSGDGFSNMHFDTYALPPARFAAWAAGMRGHGPTLDRASWDELAKNSSGLKPYAYGAVAPGLFEALVLQKIPPAPGPAVPGPGGLKVTPRSVACPGTAVTNSNPDRSVKCSAS